MHPTKGVVVMDRKDAWDDMELARKENLARHCDLKIDSRLYYDLVKWDIESHNFARKGPYYTSEENRAVCETIVAILEEYFSEKNPGHLMCRGRVIRPTFPS